MLILVDHVMKTQYVFRRIGIDTKKKKKTAAERYYSFLLFFRKKEFSLVSWMVGVDIVIFLGGVR